MKKIILSLVVMTISLASFAVPARRGFHDFQQPDGTTISLQLVGDEFAHWYESADGTVYKQTEDGRFLPANQVQLTTRRKAAPKFHAMQQRRAKQIGSTPNPAPKGVVILANFNNKQMNAAHTQAVFDELCNSTNCTVNSYNGVNYGSAAQYFADQSNGAYRPQFDVFGPVTLSRTLDYYGHNLDKEGNPTDESNDETEDQYATDAVVEACRLANQQFTINWSEYDSDNDGYIDFVYVIYAGKGEADGGEANTIWPHNWTVSSARSYGNCTYSAQECRVGGKTIENYAMSGELSGNSLGGIGTLCHEFGHVMGLPDLYDTEYGVNYDECLTPGDWNIMDGGSYNADGHCPPNYDPWEKEFFGWNTSINLGNEGQNVTLYANGTANYQAYQITSNGNYKSPTTSGVRYYIENRQAVGWDAPLTGHGMLIWKVNFDANKWANNEPNNTDNNPYYTVVSASGDVIGYKTYTPYNTFPGAANKTSWNGVSGKPLLNIAESNQIVTLTYIEEPAIVVDPFDIVWMSNGSQFTTTNTTTGKVVMPTTQPTACDGKVFVGWCAQANYEHATTAPTFVKAGDAVAEGAVFYAVFAEQSAGGATVWNLVSDASSLSAGDVLVMACSSKGFTAGDISSQIMASVESTFSNDESEITALGSGTVELTLGGSAGAWTLSSASGLLGATAVKKLAWGSGTTTWSITISGDDATIQNTTQSYGRFLYNVNSPRFTTYSSSTSASMLLPQLYRKEGGVGYINYTTSCGGDESVIDAVSEQQSVVRKEIRNGQLLIIRGEAVYTLTGIRVE